MDKLVFALEDVYFSYLGKFPALCGITMQVQKGSRVAVIGANGTGKSTLLSLLDGLSFPDRGKLYAFGKPLSERMAGDDDFWRPFRRRVGFVFQNPDIQLFCPSVREDIVFGPLQMEIPPAEINRRLESLSGVFGIAGLLDRQPHQLSIGEKKKVAIASVLAIEPEVLLLDEPTAGLDPQTSREIVEILFKEHEKGTTIVTATHDLHIIEEIADTVHVIGIQKKIIRSGPSAQVLADQVFLQENNLVHIHSHRHKDMVHTHSHTHSDHHRPD